MDQDFAQRLFREGAMLLMLNTPPGTEIGIDLHSWNTGQKFKGIKMIPPGLHFVYHSTVDRHRQVAPRTGFFHLFKPKEILIKTYNAESEDFFDEDQEQVERIKMDIRSFDAHLGAYPLEMWKKWVSLSQYIDEEHLAKVLPTSGKVCSVGEFISSEEQKDCKRGNSEEQKEGEEQKEEEEQKKGEESKDDMVCDSKWNWCELPKRPFDSAATAAERTLHSLDSSHSLDILLNDCRSGNTLSELQVSFVVFLSGQSWSGWERWRLLIEVICRAERSLLQHHQLFDKVIGILYHQIQEVPEDLFVDIVEQQNFLAVALSYLFANVQDNSDQLPKEFVDRILKFKRSLVNKFKWDFSIDNDEDLPVVVEM